MCPDRRATFRLLTCEHGGNDVPARYRHLFDGASAALESHRGYDPGALGVAREMAARLAAPLIFSTTSRLLVELNRSPDHPMLFSEFAASLSRAERQEIVATLYAPYRGSVETTIAAAVGAGHEVHHVGVHSCADELDGDRRDLDIALLFNTDRAREAALCERWVAAMRRVRPELRYRFNEPYRGADDGLTTTMRGTFPPDAYLGIEVEVRQGMIGGAEEQRVIGELLSSTLALSHHESP